MARSVSIKKAFFARRRRLRACAFVFATAVLSAAAALLISTPAARASDILMQMPTGTPNFVGLGVGGYPDYIGSDDYSVGVAHGSDVPLEVETLTACAGANPKVVKTPESEVLFMKFGESPLDFELCIWIEDVRDRLQAISDLHQEIDRRFREANIEIAFPQRDLHLRSFDESVISRFRKIAEERKAKVNKIFAKIGPLLEQTKNSFEPLLADLKDLRTFLRQDLTVEGVDAAKNVIAKTSESGAKVQTSLDALVDEINPIGADLTPAKAAPPKQ